MNRLDRLTAILIMLQTKKIVKAREISNRFEISLRTVYRDMRALDEAGVPIGAEAGVGYYLIEGYHLPPVMFTPEEAGSLLIAEKLVENFSDESVKSNFKLAADKIKSVLPSTHQEFLGQLGSQVQVFHKPFVKTEGFHNNHITVIQQALSDKNCLALQYFSKYKKESVCRVVEPVGLCFYSFNWHLIAFCQLRKDYRDFRLDRIEKCSIEKCSVSEKADISISEYFNSHWSDEELINVLVHFDPKVDASVLNSRYYFGFYEEEKVDGSLIMKFAVNDYGYIASWLLSLGDTVKKVEPDELNKYLVERVRNLSNKYL